jgi:predicted ATP-dependent serine protease
MQVCSLCGHENDPAVDRCSNCDEVLDVVNNVLSRHAITKNPRWLQEARESAGTIKAAEEASSQHRLEEMKEADRKRQEAILLEKARQDELERRTLSVTMIGTAVILVIIVIATLVITLRG